MMKYDELIKRLTRYTPKGITDHLDPDFADAVYEAIGDLMAAEQWIMRLEEENNDLKHKLLVAVGDKDFFAMNLSDCKNELCLQCGNYKQAHKGACDDCRWYKIAAGGSGR